MDGTLDKEYDVRGWCRGSVLRIRESVNLMKGRFVKKRKYPGDRR